MGGPQAGPAERGTATARRDRPRARQRPRDRVGGRADREPGLGDVGPDHGPPRPPESVTGANPRPRDARRSRHREGPPPPAHTERRDRPDAPGYEAGPAR